jgi:hypothetical protein
MGGSYNAQKYEIKYELSRHFSDEFKHNGFAITLQ